MQLLLTNCNTTTGMTELMVTEARQAAAPDTLVTGLTPAWGPDSCEGWLDSFVSAAAVLDAVLTHLAEGASYQGLVMAGFGEHGRQAAREALDFPVVDITEAAAHLAMLLGDRYAVVTSLDRTIPLIEDSLRSAGLLDRCQGMSAVELPVLTLETDPEATTDAFVRSAAEHLAGGADVLVLGCAGMSHLRARLSDRLGVPVVDGIAAAVTLAESLARLQLSTSRSRGYAPPRAKSRPGWPVSRELGRTPTVHRDPAAGSS